MAAYILVAEDDPSIGELLIDALSEEGHAVEIVEEGTAVLPAIQAHRPDLIILDIGLPKMEGNDVLVLLKLMDITDIPVIVSTARPSPERYLALGAVAVLHKPYTIHNLMRLVIAHAKA
jgi:DNA-binding response OmpR family regulator